MSSPERPMPEHPSHLVLTVSAEPAVMRVPWQTGPVQESGVNGVQAPEVIAQVRAYLEAVNAEPFRSHETDQAIVNLGEALYWLALRTSRREARGVEGTAVP